MIGKKYILSCLLLFPMHIYAADATVMTEGLLLPHLSAQAAYNGLLVNKLWHTVINKYRKNLIAEFHNIFCANPPCPGCDKKHDLVLSNGDNVDSRSIVFDVSGNAGCGISSDGQHLKCFSTYPEYKFLSEAPICTKTSDKKRVGGCTTLNSILGAYFFFGTIVEGVPNGYITRHNIHCISYLPSGNFKTANNLSNIIASNVNHFL